MNLEGIHLLSKSQQKKISGGKQKCTFTIDGAEYTVDGYTDGVAGSAEANSDCVGAIMAGASKCSYDCEYDGFGQ